MFSKIKKELSFKGLGLNMKTFYYTYPVIAVAVMLSYLIFCIKKLGIRLSLDLKSMMVVGVVGIIFLYTLLLLGKAFVLVYKGRKSLYRNYVLSFVVSATVVIVSGISIHTAYTYSMSKIELMMFYFKMLNFLTNDSYTWIIYTFSFGIVAFQIYTLYATYRVTKEGFWVATKSVILSGILSFVVTAQVKKVVASEVSKKINKVSLDKRR